MIEDSLLDFLETNLKETQAKDRNIRLINYFYGFSDSEWPTLEETGKRFGEITRERVRQLVNDNFRKIADKSKFSELSTIYNLIASKKFWLKSEIEKKLEELNLVKGNCNIKGILNMMDDLDFNHDLEIYTPHLEVVTREKLSLFEDFIVVKKSQIKNLQSIYKKAKNLPGRCGVANLDYLSESFSSDSEILLIKSIIKLSDHSWYKEANNEFWYLFEHKDNTLINYSEKVFSELDACSSKRLSPTYRNPLDARTYKHPYPPEDIIHDYLTSSMYFENEKGVLTFSGDTTGYTEIEKDILNYLSQYEYVMFPEFNEYLEGKGYGRPLIIKATTKSPLVHIDKSDGRYHYRYSLVSKKKTTENIKSDNRYTTYLRKLRKLSEIGTDIDVESKRRTEQSLLQKWLFEGKEQEKCAICGNNFHVSSLITAHKKKRSECNNAERLDPYIVMPLCTFGCDFLYEKRYIYIENGIICQGNINISLNTENKIIEQLINKKIDTNWLKGSSSYFESPNKAFKSDS